MGQLNDRVDDVVVVVGLVNGYVSELDYVFHGVTRRRHNRRHWCCYHRD